MKIREFGVLCACLFLVSCGEARVKTTCLAINHGDYIEPVKDDDLAWLCYRFKRKRETEDKLIARIEYKKGHIKVIRNN